MEPRREGPPVDDARWLLALARRIAGPGRADDLAQETLLAALRAESPAGSRRRWLAGILRNLARMERRGERRRLRREAASVRAASAPAVDAELRERLEAAVAELPEPPRSTVRRRFADSMTCAAIARADGVPASTVRNRLRRGLALVRARLLREYGGDPRALAVAALPLPRRRGRPARWAAAAAAVLGLAAHVAAAPPDPPREPVPAEERIDVVLTVEPDFAP